VPHSVTVPPSADTSITLLSTCGSQESSAATWRHSSSSIMVAPFPPGTGLAVFAGISLGQDVMADLWHTASRNVLSHCAGMTSMRYPQD
jgi:hypothetical protein